jgi:hypothetical protein
MSVSATCQRFVVAPSKFSASSWLVLARLFGRTPLFSWDWVGTSPASLALDMVGVTGSIPVVPTSDFNEKNRISPLERSVNPNWGLATFFQFSHASALRIGSSAASASIYMPYQGKIFEPVHAPSVAISAKPMGYQSPTKRGLSSVQLLA